jgi:hypothetical protein
MQAVKTVKSLTIGQAKVKENRVEGALRQEVERVAEPFHMRKLKRSGACVLQLLLQQQCIGRIIFDQQNL